jgi:outer membrane lipoprotein carrier protein
LGREIVERGVVQIKRPGRMRWEYQQPDKKTFVCDGTTFFFYVPAERQVIVREQAGVQGLPTLLLSGQGAIVDQFEVALEAGAAGVGPSLRLTPRRPDPEIESVRLDLDARERIVGLEVLDVQGNRSRFRFDDLREDLRLPDRLFRFEVPPGVEVVTG